MIGFLLHLLTSAFGTKRTSRLAQSMSAFGGKADVVWRRLTIGYGALQATIASGRVRLATEGGAKIA